MFIDGVLTVSRNACNQFFQQNFCLQGRAQGLSRSVSAFSSFMREYLDPFVKADQCAQYVDDIGIAANNATDLTRNIRAVFKCYRNAGLKLTIEKCHFGVRQVEFLGRAISSEGVLPQSHKIQNFYKLLKAEIPINITSELKDSFDSVNKVLNKACELALNPPIPGKQLVLTRDASFRSAGYDFIIEDNLDNKIQSKHETYAPVAFGSKLYSPAQLKLSIYSREISAIYTAFLEFAHILWWTIKPTIVLTDNKLVNWSHDFSRRKQFRQHCGMHVTTHYNVFPK